MTSPRSLFCTVCVCPIVAGLSAATVLAQPSASPSPFLPPGQTAAPVAVTENSPVEFRGVLNAPSGRMFGLFDPVKKITAWVKLNESGREFLVKNYDEKGDVLTVEYQGRSVTLKLQEAKIGAMAANAMPMPMPANINQPVPQPPVVLNPTPADEARRLESVAAEVRRRRALRQAATQPGAAQPAPGPAMQPGQPRQ